MPSEENTPRVTRRRLLVIGAGAAAGTLAACGGGSSTPVPRVRALPAGRPDRQFDWDSSLHSDGFGNRTAPKHHRLVHLELTGPPTVAAAAALEDGLRAIEEATPAGPKGLLLLVGWGPAWFNVLDLASPIPEPTALTADEAPDLDRSVACVHLASDEERLLETAETQLRRAVRSPFAVGDRRVGFTAPGVPRRLSGTLNGIPEGHPRKSAPLFMGFASGFARNQATEDDIAIADGPWTGATTMHVSVLSLALATWYGSLNEQQRVERMFAPGIKLARVLAPRDGIDPPDDVVAAAKQHGLVGHAQSMAALRRNGRPRILRRDFNGIDGKQPLVHFVALQRSIEDFVLVRQAMAAPTAVAADDRVTPHINNGINEWTATRSRANYIVPPRARRTCPGLDGWDG